MESDNVERCVLEGYRGVWVRETDYDALRTELERVTQQRDEAVKALEEWLRVEFYEEWRTDEVVANTEALLTRIKGETT